MYGARPIKRWVEKNVITKLSELLVRGEADEGSTISIDAAVDGNGLKYEVVKKSAPFPVQRGKKRVVEVPSDSESDGNVVEVTPVQKKKKGAAAYDDGCIVLR